MVTEVVIDAIDEIPPAFDNLEPAYHQDSLASGKWRMRRQGSVLPDVRDKDITEQIASKETQLDLYATA